MSGNNIQALDAQHRKPFLRWVKRRFGISEADAQDVYQDSVTAFAQREAKNYDSELECQPSTFLYAIGRNQTLKLIRSRKASNGGTIDAETSNSLFELPDVESMFDMEHARTVVREGLARLSERQREVLRLYYFEERTMQEIAEIMGYNNANVAKKMKYEGLKKLSTVIMRTLTGLLLFHAF
ncbi:MAG: sigma-70 family RNA polymerase sigma factor [Flavobacteriales bacterium]|nr:sigma-70 family RNA polymerase sigma factor [Flavobacteriales bacterium]